MPALDLPRRRAWTIALAATLTMTVSQLDRSTLAILAPTVTKELAITDVGYGWLASAFSVSYLLGAPFAGWFIDRIGARRGLMTSVLVWSIVAGLHALTVGLATLFALRLALGLAESPSYPGSAQTIQRVLPARDRSRGFGVLFTGSSMGVMIAAPLSTWLFTAFGWRIAFLGTSVIGLAWVPIWTVLTRREDVRLKIDLRPPGASATTSPAKPTAAWHRFLREPDVVRGIVAVCATAPTQALAILWGAKYLAGTFAVPQKDMGHFLWIPLVGFDLAALVFGDLAARQTRPPNEPPRLLFAMAALLSLGLALLPLVETPWAAVAVMTLAVSGSGGMYTLLVSDLLPRVPPTRVALAGSLLPAAQSLTWILASPLVGWSVSVSKSYSPVAIALAAWTVPGAVVWLVRRPRWGVG